jgi:carnitine 3-dehydrogenase
MGHATCSAIRRVCLVGTGVIGSGWAARYLARGLDVVATDPAPGAEERLKAAVANAWPALERVGLAAGASQERLSFRADLTEAVASVDFVQENAPEREDLKRRLLAQIDAVAPPEILIASSSSGLLPTRIQADCRHLQRVLIGHPFNPVYLLPLVEVVGGAHTAPEAVERAMEFYRSVGMRPLRVRQEIEGYLSDRLQEALWRESLHLVADGVATTGELDDAITYGPGLRWALMGTNLTFHLAGGDEGMAQMLRQFGPALKLPWTKLEAPELTDELVARMVAGTKAQAAGRSVKELERWRDDFLVRLLELLKDYWPQDAGADRTTVGAPRAAIVPPGPLVWHEAEVLTLHEAEVLPAWVDYNGHMSEAYYVLVFGHTTDALLETLGLTAAYRERTGTSLYTAEAHITYLHEVAAGERLRVTTQLLDVDRKRLRVFHTMYRAASDTPLATEELLLVHVDTTGPRSVPFAPEVLSRLEGLRAAHAALPTPTQAGHAITMRPR